MDKNKSKFSPWARIGAILIVVALIGMFAAILIPAFSVDPPPAPVGQDTIGAVLGTALLFYLFAKLTQRERVWMYPIVGVLVVFLAYFANAYVHGRIAATSMEAELITSVEKFDPALGSRMRVASDTGDQQAAIAKSLKSLIKRAVRQAPDEAVLAFNRAQLPAISVEADPSRARCAAMASGAFDFAKTSRKEQLAFLRAITALIDAAAAHGPAEIPIDVPRAQSMLETIYRKADPNNTLSDIRQFSALPDTAKCDVYLGIVRGIYALPPADAALVLRYTISMAGVS